MTCIAVMRDDQIGRVYMASERLAVDSAGGKFYLTKPKFVQIGDWWFGTAGDVRADQIFCNTMQGWMGRKEVTAEFFMEAAGDKLTKAFADKANDSTRDFSGVAIRGGHVYLVEQSWEICECKGPWGVGSGASYALGYMHTRVATHATVLGALKTAIHYDSSCGGEIDVQEILFDTVSLLPRTDSLQ